MNKTKQIFLIKIMIYIVLIIALFYAGEAWAYNYVTEYKFSPTLEGENFALFYFGTIILFFIYLMFLLWTKIKQISNPKKTLYSIALFLSPILLIALMMYQSFELRMYEDHLQFYKKEKVSTFKTLYFYNLSEGNVMGRKNGGLEIYKNTWFPFLLKRYVHSDCINLEIIKENDKIILRDKNFLCEDIILER